MSRRGGGQFGYLRDLANRFRESTLGDRKLESCVPKELRLPFEAYTEHALEEGTPWSTMGEIMYQWLPRYAEEFGIGLDEWEVVREMCFIHEAAFDALDLDNMVVEALPIFERGCKIRIVTKAPGAFVYALQSWNTLLLDLLARDPAVAPALKLEDQREEFVELLERNHPLPNEFIFRSADLTAATDLMPRDLCQALAEGTIDGLGIPRDSKSAQLLILATGNLKCRWGGEEEVTSRGILMGLPTSWPLLCIYNMWMHSRAWREGMPRSYKKAWVALYRVIGDDYVSLVPPKVNQAYTRVLLRTGGLPSEGKDLASAKGFVFGEEAAIRDTFGVQCIRTVSVRSLLGEAEWTRNGASVLDVPLSISSAFDKADSGLKHRIHHIVRDSHAVMITRMRKVGIPPFLPRSVGGGGYPSLRPNREYRKEFQYTRALRILLSSIKQEKGTSLQFSKLSTAWFRPAGTTLQSPKWADEFIEKQVREFGFKALVNHPTSISLEDAYRQVLTFWQVGEETAFGVVSQDKLDPTMSQIGKALRGKIAELNHSVPAHRLSDLTDNMIEGIRLAVAWVTMNCRVDLPPSCGFFCPSNASATFFSQDNVPAHHG